MQLAATQRPHPPPVPPRPSRQVVAEALKRSPRPPCPTRQAPPPPNTKPWRSDRERSNNRQQVCPAAGRTVIYESIKESLPKETCNESSDHDDHPTRLVAKSRGGGGGEPVPRAASERRVDEDDRRGNPRERRHRTTATDQEHRGNSSEPNAVIGDVSPSSISRQQDDRSSSVINGLTTGERLPVTENARSESPISSTREPLDRHGDVDVDHEDQGTGDDDDDTAKLSTIVESKVSVVDDAQCRASSESVIEKSGSCCNFTEKKTQCAERTATKKIDAPMRPMPTQRSSLFKYRDTTKNNADNRSCSENSCGKQPPVSDVDRATVVVIDESDRKATSNDEPDNRGDVCDYHGDHRKDKGNENDNNDNDHDNIHRQDWLEAGVHYSSTQIRLSGEEGDVIDGNRVNGLDRYPNEKFGDLNVPR
ncbi:PREDICTED: uncharacterized protein LOC108548663 [Eufriesea mexicana]|uniref:uncharacterized protein LOC108548663 n=1 Tax=Eufriesea mexicana TaxID=516756 RepID=UPI00083C16B8|nr:PREDICTED: uncharacterized protein LOC108548663 [Eufriesea mexicana]